MECSSSFSFLNRAKQSNKFSHFPPFLFYPHSLLVTSHYLISIYLDPFSNRSTLMDSLPKCQANSSALTPLTFLKRAAACYANRTSVIHEGTRFTWQQTYERCRRLASSLRALNIAGNDVVSCQHFTLVFAIRFLMLINHLEYIYLHHNQNLIPIVFA